MPPEMTDIHDIRPVLPPDFRPLIFGIALILIIVALLIWQARKHLKGRKKTENTPLFIEGFKDLTLKELRTIREQLEKTEEPDISYFTSRIHHTLKWYLSNKLQKRVVSGTLTEVITYIPQSFGPLLTFCYSVIYPWQKRTRMEIVAFIDNSIETVKNDI